MKATIIEMMDSAVSAKFRISYKELEQALNENPGDNFSSRDFKNMLDFISRQCGAWTADWHFSDVTSPDLNAKEESEGWYLLWQASAPALSESVTIPIERLQQLHNITVLQDSLKRRIDFNSSRQLEKTSTYIAAKLSFLLNSLGFMSIAADLYTRSLYPKGAVGRNLQ